MKALIASLVTFLTCLNPGAASQHVTFAVSPWLAPADTRLMQAGLLQLILQDAPAGARLRVYDAGKLVTVTEFTLSDAHRERRHRVELAQLLGWFRATAKGAGSLTNTGAVNIPAVLDEAGRSIPAGGVLVVLGSPLSYSPGEPSFDFVIHPPGATPEYRYPSDGLLLAPRDASPFSVVGRETQLAGRQVHFLYAGEHLFPNPLYKDNVARFWALSLQLRGGQLGSFSADRQHVFKALFNDSPATGGRFELDAARMQPRMLRDQRQVREELRTNALPQSVSQVIQSFDRHATGATFSIGIMWDVAGVDADLYVFLSPTGRPLYFGNKETSAGKYLQDYMNSNAGIDYEQVILNQTPPPQMEAWVNLFKAPADLAAPLTGKLMVRQNGRTVIGSFQIVARAGNAAGNREGRAADPHWSRLHWQPLASQNVAVVP